MSSSCAGWSGPARAADTNGDDVVDVVDLLNVLASWGPNPGHPADTNDDDDMVDVIDLLAVLGACARCT